MSIITYFYIRMLIRAHADNIPVEYMWLVAISVDLAAVMATCAAVGAIGVEV